MEPSFEPRKVRDFGEIINDTFVFVFQTWKPLLKIYFTICGFFLAASFFTSLLQQFKMMKTIKGGLGPDGRYAGNVLSSFFGFEYLVALCFSLITYTAISLTTIAFIHLYKEKENEVPTTEKVWEYVKFHFFKFLLAGVLMPLLVTVGFVLCLIPGLYLWPIVALIFPIMMMENSSFGFAFTKAFTLIKDNWWSTFGVQFIMFMIIMMGSFIVMVPLSLAGMGGFFLAMGKASTLSVILQVIFSQLALVLWIFPNIATALCYYSLSEQKDGNSLTDRINNLGRKSTANQDSSPEEY